MRYVFGLAVLLATATPHRASAQTTVDDVPPEVAASDPRVAAARVVVARLFASDRPGVESVLRQHGTEAYVRSAGMTQQLDRLVAKTPTEAKITAVRRGRGQDVVVEVESASGMRAIAVRFSEEPHRIIGLLELELDTGG